MNKLQRILRGIAPLLLAVALTAGCGGGAVYAPDSAGKVLAAVLTWPGDLAEVRGTSSEEEAWYDAVGSYMTEEAFEAFYQSEDRTRFGDWAEKTGSALTLQDIRVEKNEEGRQVLLTAVDVIAGDSSVKSTVLRWEIEYTIEDADRILALRCIDAGDLMSGEK